MDNYLQQGIMAAKAGDKPRAFDLLIRASNVPATSEQAWLWLSGVVNDDSERLFCLDSVLRINPNNSAAQRGAAMLRKNGVFPAVPVYPEPQEVAPVQGDTSKQASSPPAPPLNLNIARPGQTQTASAPVAKSKPEQQSRYPTDLNKQELLSYFQYAAMELSSNKSQQAVEKLVVGRGASAEVAKAVVKDAQYAIKKERRAKYQKRMMRGFLWTIAGIVITCGTYAFASSLGGKYVLFYGAIIFGLIDFAIGLIGWLANA